MLEAVSLPKVNKLPTWVEANVKMLEVVFLAKAKFDFEA